MRELANGVRVTSLHLRKLTLPKFQTWAKCVLQKVTYRRIRKEAEKFGRGEGEFLMKKGCKMGVVSL